MNRSSEFRPGRDGRRRRFRHPAAVMLRPDAERLEDRRLLTVSVTVNQVPWIDQGPGPISPPVETGAVEAVAVDPNPNDGENVYIASVNGGIWHDDPGASQPFASWTPQTDQLPSLSISTIAFSPLSSNVLYAGLGDTSHYAGVGGPLDSGDIYTTTDGGATWSVVGENTLNNDPVWKVLPTAITSSSGQVVLAATKDGLLRSTDSGNTWSQVTNDQTDGPMNQTATDVVAGFNAGALNQTSYYASMPKQGVFRSDDGGLTWTPVDSGLTGTGSSSSIKLAIHDDSQGNHVVYVEVAQGAGQLPDVFRTTDQGSSWTSMSAPPYVVDPSNPYDFSAEDSPFVADPNDPDGVYMAGYDADANHGEFIPSSGTTTWTDLYGANDSSGDGANGTAPHTDARGMAFDHNGDLLEGNDGGIYELITPTQQSTREWGPVNGNLQLTEMVTVGYDALNQTILGGARTTATSPSRPAASSRTSVARVAMASRLRPTTTTMTRRPARRKTSTTWSHPPTTADWGRSSATSTTPTTPWSPSCWRKTDSSSRGYPVATNRRRGSSRWTRSIPTRRRAHRA